MQIRDRIKDFRRVEAKALRPNPRNWRTHPARQRDALRGVLSEIGYASALVARELPDGSLELIDGHLRAETTPDQVVPVLVLDVSEAEASKLLATLDPLAALAGADQALLDSLLSEVETESRAVQTMLDGLLPGGAVVEDVASDRPEIAVPELYQVVIECGDEDQQRAVFERLTAEGYACRLLHL